MTIEELSVRITAEADEALAALDEVTQRLSALDSLMSQNLRLTLDTAGSAESVGLLESQLVALEERLGQQSEAVYAAMQSVLAGLSQSATQAGMAAGSAAGQMKGMGQAGQEAGRQMQQYRSQLQAVASRLEQLGRQRTAIQSLKQMDGQMDGASRSAKGLQSALRNTERIIAEGVNSVYDLDDSFHGMAGSFDAASGDITVNAQSLYGQLGGLVAWAQNAADSLHISGSVSVDTSGAVGQLNELIAVAQMAQSILAGMGVAAGGAASAAGGSGGGGGGRNAEEEAARAAEEARKEALRLDYEKIEHQRHMQEITLEEEVALLEKLRTRHRMTAEEIMDWEERVFDVKEEIRRRDQENLDRLTQGVVDALGKQYEAMQQMELDRLDESRRAWEGWRDGSVKAIEDQIAALDRLMEAEEREDQDAQELRRMEKLRQDIAYEQDEYNRRKLEEQLEAAMQAREDRLHRQELEDRRSALEAEAERIRQAADEELNRLDEQEAAIQEAYAKRMEEAALEAEAEKMVLAGNQEAILALLNAYAPRYDQLGRTLGERLLTGFESTVGDLVGWFENLSNGLAGAQQQLMSPGWQAVGTAAPSGGSAAGVTITQNIAFHQPVESPGDVARRMESVNEALGEWLSQEG